MSCPVKLNTVTDLRKDITRFVLEAGGFEMPDMRVKAEACQEWANGHGYQWDRERLLWRDTRKEGECEND